MSAIQAAIFDMDGLLVDSEPWWRVAESNIFGKLSVSPTEEDFEATVEAQITAETDLTKELDEIEKQIGQ